MQLETMKIVRVSNAVAAGTTAIEATAVDMQGFDSVMFLVPVGTLTSTAVTSLKAQQGAASNGSDAADLAGTSVAIADDQDNKVAVLEVHRPTGRYVRPVVSRGTANAVVDGIIAILFNGRKLPIALDTTLVSTSKAVASPALGTP